MDVSLPREVNVAATGGIYRFGAGQNGNEFLTRGWGEPENGFVWSEGKYGVVTLPAVPGRCSLAISLWGYVPAGAPAQELLIFVNGKLKTFSKVHEKIIIAIEDTATEAETLEIQFYMPQAISPKQAEQLKDARVLGIALVTIVAEQN
ncbi:MAG: hypothetical protein P4L54_03555 [Acidocella sp.]|nr:hypothetical protein [Acidocella sp.]